MNNKGADQSARMRRLVCAFVVRKPRRQVFSRRGPFHSVVLENPLCHKQNLEKLKCKQKSNGLPLVLLNFDSHLLNNEDPDKLASEDCFLMQLADPLHEKVIDTGQKTDRDET